MARVFGRPRKGKSMAWSDDDEAREAIKELIAAIRVIANSALQSHGAFGDVMAHVDRAEEIAERIDKPIGHAPGQD